MVCWPILKRRMLFAQALKRCLQFCACCDLLRLDVVFLGRPGIGVTQNRCCNADMFGIVQGDKSRGTVAKEMRVDVFAKGTFGCAGYAGLHRPACHWPTIAGDPEPIRDGVTQQQGADYLKISVLIATEN